MRDKTLRFEVNVWVDPLGSIHVAAINQFITTISPDPSSLRHHEHLYAQLTKCLVDAGKWPDGAPPVKPQ